MTLLSFFASALPVTVAVFSHDPGVPAGVTAMLASSLAPAGVAVTEGAPEAAAATIDLRAVDGGVRIVIEDGITKKTAERTVSLVGVPDDARTLTVASAADGLLRASWLETLVATAPASPAPVVAIARATVEPRVDRPRLGVRGAAEATTGGTWLVGGDALFELPLVARMVAGVHVGARTIPDTTTTHGSIDGHAFVAGTSLGYELTRPGAARGIVLGPTVALASVTYAGAATAPAAGHAGSGLGMTLGGTASAFWRLRSRWRLVASLSAGGVVRGVRAADAGVEATAFRGASFGASFAILAEP